MICCVDFHSFHLIRCISELVKLDLYFVNTLFNGVLGIALKRRKILASHSHWCYRQLLISSVVFLTPCFLYVPPRTLNSRINNIAILYVSIGIWLVVSITVKRRSLPLLFGQHSELLTMAVRKILRNILDLEHSLMHRSQSTKVFIYVALMSEAIS